MVAATTKKTENSFTVFRRQVIQTGSYEPSEASCSVTITVDPTLTKEELGVEIAEWGATCDIANYEALGLAYEVAAVDLHAEEQFGEGFLAHQSLTHRVSSFVNGAVMGGGPWSGSSCAGM